MGVGLRSRFQALGRDEAGRDFAVRRLGAFRVLDFGRGCLAALSETLLHSLVADLASLRASFAAFLAAFSAFRASLNRALAIRTIFRATSASLSVSRALVLTRSRRFLALPLFRFGCRFFIALLMQDAGRP